MVILFPKESTLEDKKGILGYIRYQYLNSEIPDFINAFDDEDCDMMLQLIQTTNVATQDTIREYFKKKIMKLDIEMQEIYQSVGQLMLKYRGDRDHDQDEQEADALLSSYIFNNQ